MLLDRSRRYRGSGLWKAMPAAHLHAHDPQDPEAIYRRSHRAGGADAERTPAIAAEKIRTDPQDGGGNFGRDEYVSPRTAHQLKTGELACGKKSTVDCKERQEWRSRSVRRCGQKSRTDPQDGGGNFGRDEY